MEILRYFNWVDILMVGIIIRIIYIGLKNGVVLELFKLAAAIFAVFITLHYYSGLGRFVHAQMQFLNAGLDFFTFGFLWLLVLGIFKLIRDGLLLILRIEANAALQKWGGLVLAVGRSTLVCSLLFLMLAARGGEYMDRNLRGSLLRPYTQRIALNIYRWSYGGIVSKFFPEEELNAEAFGLVNLDGMKQ